MTLDQIINNLHRAWSDDLREPRFNQENPRHISRGLCVETSLLIQRHHGGNIMRCKVAGTVHYFNELPNGTWIDATRAQFTTPARYEEIQRNSPQELYIFKDTWNKVDELERRLKLSVLQ